MSRIEENGKGLELNLNQLGLQVKLVKTIANEVGETYLFDLVYISQYNKKYIQSLVDKLAVFYHLNITLIDSKEAHFGLFVKFASNVISLAQCINEVGCRDIVIGKDTLGNNVIIDFEKIPHLLIGGATGSGKSVLLKNLITNLLIHYDKNHNRFKKCAITIVDTKNSDLKEFAKIPNVSVANNVEQAISTLKKVEQIMDNRYQTNTSDYDLYVVIDELADLMLTSRFEVEKSIVRIAQLGRACNIHIIIATQSPRCEVVSGIIKVNLPYRICLKTASVRDSVVIMDSKGCEVLDIGEAIFKQGMTQTKLKIAYPEPELVDKVITVNRG